MIRTKHYDVDHLFDVVTQSKVRSDCRVGYDEPFAGAFLLFSNRMQD
jgi:hypothetical protein